jgi:Zn-dependent protease
MRSYAPAPRIEVIRIGPDPRPGAFFSPTELRHLAIGGGALLAMMVAADVSVVLRSGSFSVGVLALLVAVDLIAVGTAFFLHEMAHKVSARAHGAWAEFRHSPFQLLAFGFLFSLFGFIFALPGAVWTAGNFTKRQNGIVSAVGPATNMAIAGALLPVYLLLPTGGSTFFEYLLSNIIFLNAWLGFFNMLPLKLVHWNDGMKVWEWSKPVYVAMIAPLAVLSGALMLGLI